MTVSDLFKKFRCGRPAPILPTSQIQTTSFTYQLAFVQWALEYVLQEVEGYTDRLETLETKSTDFGNAIEQLQNNDDTVFADLESLDDRVTALENGGGGEIQTGSGNIVDTMIGGAGTVGTYDYSIFGNLLTVTLHVESAPLSTALGVKLDGLEAVLIPAPQRFGFIQNNFGEATTHSLEVQFYMADNAIHASAKEAGVAYISNFQYLDDATFTLRVNQ